MPSVNTGGGHVTCTQQVAAVAVAFKISLRRPGVDLFCGRLVVEVAAVAAAVSVLRNVAAGGAMVHPAVGQISRVHPSFSSCDDP